jgi:hypothetical protein
MVKQKQYAVPCEHIFRVRQEMTTTYKGGTHNKWNCFMIIADYCESTWNNIRNTVLETEITNPISTNFTNRKFLASHTHKN